MCGFGAKAPKAPPPPPPPPPDPVFQAGSPEDTASVNASTSTKRGKASLKTEGAGLNIPTGG
jgi:hypothetical protein